MAEWIIGLIGVLLCLFEGYCIQSFFGRFAVSKMCRIRNAEWAAGIAWVVIRIVSEGLFSDTDGAALIMELLFTFSILFVFCVCWYQGNILLKAFLAVQFISLRELSFWAGYSLLYIGNEMIEVLVHKAGTSMISVGYLPVAADILSCFCIFLVGAAQCALLFISTRKIAGSYCSKEKGQMGKEVVFYLLPSVAGVLVSVLVRLLLITVTGGVPVLLYEKYPALYLIIPMIALVLLGAIVFSFRIYQSMAALQEERAEKIVLENQITQMQSSMVEMEHLYDGIRSVKHDMKNHMTVLQNLIQKRYSGEDEEIPQYFEGMYQSVEQLDGRVHTGNAVSDAVVGCKFRYAAKKVKGIKLDARGFMLSDAVTIKAYDMGIILNNGLDNAIEACMRMRKKQPEAEAYITIRSFKAKNMYFIEIENSFDGAVLFHKDSGLPISTKEEQPIQEGPEPEMPEQFAPISSLITSNNENFMAQQTEKYAAVPIEQYSGFYTEVPSAGSSVLAESMGKSIDNTGEWHYVSGHSDLQYLIRNDGQESSLWKFQCFDSGEYPYDDVLKLVYQIDSADAITEIEVAPARMDNTDAGKKIQEEVGTRKITDRAAIETIYEMLSGMTCYGSGQWERIDYGDVEAAGDGQTPSHEAVRLGRYLSITTDYGNVIDGLKYTAVSDMFYEFSGIAYSPLTEEQAASICEIIGIMEYEGEDRQSHDVKTEDAQQEKENSDDGAGTALLENTNTDVSLEYVTELQTKVSSAMMNHEMPFVISSSVYENPYRLHIVVTSNAEEDLQRLRDLDTIGGVLEIEYVPENTNSRHDLYEQKN